MTEQEREQALELARMWTAAGETVDRGFLGDDLDALARALLAEHEAREAAERDAQRMNEMQFIANAKVTELRQKVEALRTALEEGRAVAGNIVWLDNNIHNYGSDGWREFFKAALRDARRFLALADGDTK